MIQEAIQVLVAGDDLDSTSIVRVMDDFNPLIQALCQVCGAIRTSVIDNDDTPRFLETF